MKEVLVLFLCIFLVWGVFIILHDRNSLKESAAEKELVHVNALQKNADKVVYEIQYIKDPRTGFCFAYYYWNTYGYGGPSLATVPCEAIPPHLLTIAK